MGSIVFPIMAVIAAALTQVTCAQNRGYTYILGIQLGIVAIMALMQWKTTGTNKCVFVPCVVIAVIAFLDVATRILFY